MAWIQSHQEIGRHPKTKRAARLLGCSVPAVLGHLHLLWHWCLDFAQDGDLGAYDAAELADAALWGGDATQFVAALIQAGFFESDGEGLRVHDWRQIAGSWLSEKGRQEWDSLRASVAPRVYERDSGRCLKCGATDDLTVDHIRALARGGGHNMTNLQTLCRSCNSRKGASA
jgi:hypothetical protein